VCVTCGPFPFFFFFIEVDIDCTNPMQRYIASINALRARVATPVWPVRKPVEPFGPALKKSPGLSLSPMRM